MRSVTHVMSVSSIIVPLSVRRCRRAFICLPLSSCLCLSAAIVAPLRHRPLLRHHPLLRPHLSTCAGRPLHVGRDCWRQAHCGRWARRLRPSSLCAVHESCPLVLLATGPSHALGPSYLLVVPRLSHHQCRAVHVVSCHRCHVVHVAPSHLGCIAWVASVWRRSCQPHLGHWAQGSSCLGQAQPKQCAIKQGAPWICQRGPPQPDGSTTGLDCTRAGALPARPAPCGGGGAEEEVPAPMHWQRFQSLTNITNSRTRRCGVGAYIQLEIKCQATRCQVSCSHLPPSPRPPPPGEGNHNDRGGAPQPTGRHATWTTSRARQHNNLTLTAGDMGDGRHRHDMDNGQRPDNGQHGQWATRTTDGG